MATLVCMCAGGRAAMHGAVWRVGIAYPACKHAKLPFLCSQTSCAGTRFPAKSPHSATQSLKRDRAFIMGYLRPRGTNLGVVMLAPTGAYLPHHAQAYKQSCSPPRNLTSQPSRKHSSTHAQRHILSTHKPHTSSSHTSEGVSCHKSNISSPHNPCAGIRVHMLLLTCGMRMCGAWVHMRSACVLGCAQKPHTSSSHKSEGSSSHNSTMTSPLTPRAGIQVYMLNATYCRPIRPTHPHPTSQKDPHLTSHPCPHLTPPAQASKCTCSTPRTFDPQAPVILIPQVERPPHATGDTYPHLTSPAQASELHQSAGNGAGTLVAATDCTRGFAGSLYAPFSTNDARAWAAAWMFKMDTSSTRYFNEAKEFLDAWLLEVQVSWLHLGFRILRAVTLGSPMWGLGLSLQQRWTPQAHVNLMRPGRTPGCWRCR